MTKYEKPHRNYNIIMSFFYQHYYTKTNNFPHLQIEFRMQITFAKDCG